MNDFKGLEDEDDNDVRSRIDQGYNNDVNIRNLKEDLRRREGAVDQRIHSMKENYIIQKAEFKSTLDSLLKLQQDMEQKNQDRRTSNNDFYTTLANENRSLLNNLRSGTRGNFRGDYSFSQSLPPYPGSSYKTPYEQRFGIQQNIRETPNIHHESVFVNPEGRQNRQESTNEVLDDLLNSYGGQNNGNFSLPIPKSSLRHQTNDSQMDQSYNKDLFNMDESQVVDGNPEDSLNQLVNEVEESNKNLQEVA